MNTVSAYAGVVLLGASFAWCAGEADLDAEEAAPALGTKNMSPVVHLASTDEALAVREWRGTVRVRAWRDRGGVALSVKGRPQQLPEVSLHGIAFGRSCGPLRCTVPVNLGKLNTIAVTLNLDTDARQCVLAGPGDAAVLVTSGGAVRYGEEADGESAAVEWPCVVQRLVTCVLTLVRESDSVSLYKDGHRVGTVALKQGGDTLIAGVSNEARPFRGVIQDVSLYDRALSADEVRRRHGASEMPFQARIEINTSKVGRFRGVLRLFDSDAAGNPKSKVVSSGPAQVEWGDGSTEVVEDFGGPFTHDPQFNFSHTYEHEGTKTIRVWLKSHDEVGKVRADHDEIEELVGFDLLHRCYTFKLWDNRLEGDVREYLTRSDKGWRCANYRGNRLTGDIAVFGDYPAHRFLLFCRNRLGAYTSRRLPGASWTHANIKFAQNPDLSAGAVSRFMSDLDAGDGESEAREGKLDVRGCHRGRLRYEDLTASGKAAHDNLVDKKGWTIWLD